MTASQLFHVPDLSRRQFLLGVGGATAGLVIPVHRSSFAPRELSSFTGAVPLRLAMHVHGSWSEGLASWEAQFTQAAANDIDVLFMTDHDGRATAYKYLATLADAAWVNSSTGAFAQKASTVNGGAIRLLAESSSATAPASVALAVQPDPKAKNKLRTGIAGQSLRHTVGACTLSEGATYEVVVGLSFHPAVGGRPAGNYELRYRFGSGTPGYSKENNGLRGVVRKAKQTAGTTATLPLGTDIAALWPDMLAMDQCFYGLSFVATSPKKGAVSDVAVTAVQFVRTQNDPAGVSANQQDLIRAYQPRFPDLSVRASTEVSRHLPDMNPFGVPQFFSDYALDTATNHDAFYRDLVTDIHTGHGVISWNHPFGYNGGPLLSSAERIAKRHSVFEQLRAVDVYGADILEVGYSLRGNVDAWTHLALWDTFSRNGRFLTGNGTNDDHGGKNWKALNNGFVTGAWATSRSDADLVSALSAGRAFVAHCGRWPLGELDMMADDSVPMGAVDVGSATSHSLSVYVKNLPPGGRVEILSGPVDYANKVDPGTTVVSKLTASSFTGGIATATVSTTSSRFVRATVRSADSTIVGAGNPIWLLRSQPPGGVPALRAA